MMHGASIRAAPVIVLAMSRPDQASSIERAVLALDPGDLARREGAARTRRVSTPAAQG
jgi:hypothetical protein